MKIKDESTNVINNKGQAKPKPSQNSIELKPQINSCTFLEINFDMIDSC